jgi:hypothetical protein
MSATPFFFPKFKFFVPGTGNPAASYWVKTFAAGTSTPLPVFVDNALTLPAANPFQLDLNGEQVVYAQAGIGYKAQLLLPDGVTPVAGELVDGIIYGNVNLAAAISEWVASGLTTTFISTTSLSVPGNQTGLLSPGRAIQTTNTGGTVYSIIQTSVFGAVTTLTLLNLYGGVLDSGLSALSYSFQGGQFLSKPEATFFWAGATSPGAMTSTVAQTQLVTAGTPQVLVDSLAEFTASNGRITVKNAGYYEFAWGGCFNTTGVTFSNNSSFTLTQNGAGQFNFGVAAFVGPGLAGGNVTSEGGCGAILKASVNDFFNLIATATFSAGAPTVSNCWLKVRRII